MALTQGARRRTTRARDPVQQLDREIEFLDTLDQRRLQKERLLRRMKKDFRRMFPRKKNPFDGVK